MPTTDQQADGDEPAADVLQPEEMTEVADDLLRGYLALIERGHHQHAIAEAMLGATVDLFDTLDLNSELPDLLRAIADRLERGGTLS